MCHKPFLLRNVFRLVCPRTFLQYVAERFIVKIPVMKNCDNVRALIRRVRNICLHYS